jgi:acyl dehydratase
MSMTQALDITVDLSDYLPLIDKDLPQPEQFNYEVTRDTIRHFAYANEDYNALYLDQEFARTTRWGGIIAPPGYLYSHGFSVWLRVMGDIRDSRGRELSQNDNAGEEWEFYLPVRPGDVITSYGKIVGAVAKHGRRTGPSAIVSSEYRYTNQRNEVVARVRGNSFRFSPLTVAERGGMAQAYPKMEEGQTTRAHAFAAPSMRRQEAPARRRDRQLYFEDVTEGMDIPEWTLGPLNGQILGRWSAAISGGGGGDPGGPRQGGVVPDMYAAGPLRTGWFGALLMQWAGPNSWVSRITYQNREWLLVGFKAICKGRVTRKFEHDGRYLVDCDVWCENDLGMVTNPGTAQVELPSRDQRA